MPANNLERKIELTSLLQKNPEWANILEEAIEVQRKGEKKHKDKDHDYIGFEWYEVHATHHFLHQMVSEKILDISFSSNSSTHYKVRDPELVRKAIKILEETEDKKIPEEGIPGDLFSPIVGYENVKWILTASLRGKKPVHILLVGPPSTAKTLFLEELSRLPGSRYILGSASSRAGIIDYLLEERPSYLIIDELEKADGKDLSALLSLMQTGIVTRMKKGMREKQTLRTWVFAGANSTRKIPRELKSRFLILPFSEYTEEEFREVTSALLEREGIGGEHKSYIIEKVLSHSKDVRDVVKVGRIAKSRSEVDRVVAMMLE